MTDHPQSQESLHPFLFPMLNLPPAENIHNKYAVEVLHYIQILKRSNAIAKKLDGHFSFDVAILYQALEHLIDGAGFSDWQLKSYFHTQRALEEFHRTLDESILETLEVHLPYPVDFQLLGFNATRYSLLDNKSRTTLHQQYEILYFELLECYCTVEEFVVSAQKLLKSI